MSTVLIFAALPEEYRFLLQATGPWRLVCRQPFRMFRASFADRDWCLVETGMGRDRILPATTWASRREQPCMVLSIGFCGSLTTTLPVGSTVLGRSFQFLHCLEDRCEAEVIGYQETAGVIAELCRTLCLQCASVVTLLQPLAKERLRRRFPGAATVVDMESYFAAVFARDRGIPFLCLRAVSDGAYDEIGFDPDSISTNGRVRILKVLALLCRRPILLPDFYHAWRRSRLAGKKLAQGLIALMHELSAEVIKLTPTAQFMADGQNERS